MRYMYGEISNNYEFYSEKLIWKTLLTELK